MQYYELTYLVRPDVKEVQSFCESINSLIQEEGGILERIERPKKMALGYQFKKQGQYLDNAYVSSLSFYLDRKKIEALEKKIAKKQGLLRFSLLKKKAKKPSKALKKVAKRKRPSQKPKPKKVELKKIEEKIEEILGE